MITLAWYLLKVILCSGILCGYYFLALRNKVFHRWNRFYLLAAIVISLSAPIMKIDIFQNSDKGTVVQMLQTISYGDEAVIEYSKSNGFQINTQYLAEGAYLLISTIFLFIFFISIYNIKKLRKKYPETKIDDISFINTNAKGTPFSFFKSIFWNNAIDLHSKPGQQIFNHEIAHVKEKHSYDKIFMNIVLIFFWINPFFWLMQKELNMIHEFVADKEALEDSDINAFAEMILQTVYPGQNFSLTNNFFYSPIKRRLLMLTKNKNPKVSYASRLLVLPLAAIIIFAFTIKLKPEKPLQVYDGKTITVIIDAGHGGQDKGATYANLQEKDITLAIAQQVKKLNNNENINIILTRDKDEFLSVHDQAKFADVNEADLFISIHINSESNENLHSGMDILVPKNDNKYLNQSKLLGSSIIESFKNNYPLKVADHLMQRERGLVVLNENSCPAILIEAGFLTTEKDRDYLSKAQNQQAIAQNILNGIENYAQQNSLTKLAATTVADTIPTMYYQNKKVTGMQVQAKSNNIKVTYSNGAAETISKQEAKKRGFVLPPPPPPVRIYNGKKVHSAEGISNQKIIIHFLDGTKETITREDAKKAGLILFTPPKILKDSIPKKVYQKVEVEASFPGGPAAWARYISRAISDSISKFTNADYGTCLIRFIVNTDGRVTDVTATTMKGTELAKVSIHAIEKGPKWIPASQNGQVVAAYRLQPVTLINPDKLKNNSTQSEPTISTSSVRKNLSGKYFTKTDQPASFPGGQTSWLKYLARIFEKNANELIADKNNLGTCNVRFIVSKDGQVNDVQPVTMKGTQG